MRGVGTHRLAAVNDKRRPTAPVKGREYLEGDAKRHSAPTPAGTLRMCGECAERGYMQTIAPNRLHKRKELAIQGLNFYDDVVMTGRATGISIAALVRASLDADVKLYFSTKEKS